MPILTPTDVHVDALLTNLSVAYIQSETKFISGKVFPVVPVAKQSDYYLSYDKEDWMRIRAERRGPAAESAGGGFSLTADNTYFAHIWAFHQDIDDPTRANSDSPLNLDRDATEFVTQQLLLAREKSWMDNFFVNGVWGTSATPGTLWDAAGSDPIGDIGVGQDAIEAATGIRPNVLTISPDVFRVLKNHSSILTRIQYTQRAVVTAELLAALFEVDNVYVTRIVYDPTADGAVAAPVFMATKRALLCYSEPSPGLLKPSAGYTFAWNGLLGAAAHGGRIKRFRLEAIASDRVEGEMAFGHEIVATALGYYFHNPIS